MSMTHKCCDCINLATYVQLSGPYAEIQSERLRAHVKHADSGSRESMHWYERSWIDVLMEEVGEVSRAFCEYYLGNITYKELAAEARKELVQVAAMASAWIDAIDDGDNRDT